MEIKIRFAGVDDFKIVRDIDPHSQYIDPEKIKLKIQGKEIILAFIGNKPVGLMKFSYFWSTRPYLDLIWFKPEFRKKGFGKQLLQFWENYLINQGHTYIFSSSQENEPEPQEWHVKQGFIKCGIINGLNLPHEEIAEIFFYKIIVDEDAPQLALKKYPLY